VRPVTHFTQGQDQESPFADIDAVMEEDRLSRCSGDKDVRDASCPAGNLAADCPGLPRGRSPVGGACIAFAHAYREGDGLADTSTSFEDLFSSIRVRAASDRSQAAEPWT